ncbi:MAG TPA: pyridoxamine 5'-phosphate oxidase family protein [Candidatus Limnocylindrales bacterium]|nr:pyridoxamine 5'-phosphate oxidase family protein [Candidatus Limnocylindrales bacterium]
MTAAPEPATELDTQFSSPGAVATPWAAARQVLQDAEIFWLSTVRPDGRPHVTSLIAVWVDDAPWFTTGPTERKARNLAANPVCVLTTGTNALSEGLDVVVEGVALRVTDHGTLQRVADAYAAKYPEPFHFTVEDGGFVGGAMAFRIRATKAFGFGRGAAYSQTRWRFEGA